MKALVVFIWVMCLVLLYHTGVSAEQQCLKRGFSAESCAELRL